MSSLSIAKLSLLVVMRQSFKFDVQYVQYYGCAPPLRCNLLPNPYVHAVTCNLYAISCIVYSLSYLANTVPTLH